MYNTSYNYNDGIIIISEELNNPIEFKNIGDQFIIRFSDIEDLLKMSSLTYKTSNVTNERYLKQYYRTSFNGINWGEWVEIDKGSNFIPNDGTKISFEIKWVRNGISADGEIKLEKYRIIGEIDRKEISSEESLILLNPGDRKLIVSPFIFKVFKIDDIEIIPDLPDDIEILYRFSQDNTRTWSQWEPLTKENITTIRINPIRFFQIEYSITNNSREIVKIQDINLHGDFQNVNNDYQKSNLFGVRECCSSNFWGYFDKNGNYHMNDKMNIDGTGWGENGEGADGSNGDTLPEMTDEDKARLYNPYAQNPALDLLEKLSGDAEQMFGHEVTYFVTDPDINGQDFTLHEYQLYNIVCKADMKVSISGNEFPDNQIKMNIFELDLFDTMEAHITKQQFKKMFGPQRRPSKEDFMFFCQVNRMYQVDHAQAFRSFNNTSVYYKLILKKYNQKANVRSNTPEMEDFINNLTNNTTVDQLFGVEKQRDKKAVANKKEQLPLTKDIIRLSYNCDIDKELIENSTTIVSKQNYDLFTNYVDHNTKIEAIQYRNLDPVLQVSDNISYMMWFNIHDYTKDDVYHFMNFYDESKQLGWKSYIKNDSIYVHLNDDVYEFELAPYNIGDDPLFMMDNIWYSIIIDIDQRQRKLSIHLYKRNVDIEADAPLLLSNKLKLIYNRELDMIPIEYSLDDSTPIIYASPMKITNIRWFNTESDISQHHKLLNMYILNDVSKNLIFGDNANTKLILPNFYFNE